MGGGDGGGEKGGGDGGKGGEDGGEGESGGGEGSGEGGGLGGNEGGGALGGGGKDGGKGDNGGRGGDSGGGGNGGGVKAVKLQYIHSLYGFSMYCFTSSGELRPYFVCQYVVVGKTKSANKLVSQGGKARLQYGAVLKSTLHHGKKPSLGHGTDGHPWTNSWHPSAGDVQFP